MEFKSTRSDRVVEFALASNASLRVYLEALNKQKAPTDRTWMLSHLLTNEQLLKAVRANAASCLEFAPSDIRGLLLKDELDSESKFGPQGGHAPIGELMSIVTQGYENAGRSKPALFDSHVWKVAKQRVLSRYPRPNLRPLTIEGAIDYVRTDGTIDSNSGFPDFSPRRLSEVQQHAVADAKSGAFFNYPAVALLRTYRQKTRLVWMFPFSTNLVEASFAVPLMKALRMQTKGYSHQVYTPWEGWRAVSALISDKYKDPHIELGSTDFAMTDASFTHWATEEVFDVVKHLFQEQYWDSLHEILMHMHNIPLLIDKKTMITGGHGVSSGSFFTNLIETVFDDIFGECVSLIVGALGIVDPSKVRDFLKKTWTEQDLRRVLNNKDNKAVIKLLFAIGDDMGWQAGIYSDLLPHILSTIAEEAGFVIQVQKTHFDRDTLKALQRRYCRGAFIENSSILRGMYPYTRAWNSLIYPERSVKNRRKKTNVYRYASICDNCSDNYGFTAFLDQVFEGDPAIAEVCSSLIRNRDEILDEDVQQQVLKLRGSYIKANAKSEALLKHRLRDGIGTNADLISSSPSLNYWCQKVQQ